MTRARVWTQAEIDTMKAMLENGASCTEVGAAVGVSRANAARKAAKLGLKRRSPGVKWTQAEVDRLREMAAQGATVGDVTTALGRSVRSVQQKCGVLGVRLTRKTSETQLSKAVDELESFFLPYAAVDESLPGRLGYASLDSLVSSLRARGRGDLADAVAEALTHGRVAA